MNLVNKLFDKGIGKLFSKAGKSTGIKAIALASAGIIAVGAHQFTKEFDFAKKIKWVKGDITNYKAVEESIKNKDVIINLAAVIHDNANFNPLSISLFQSLNEENNL